jgi:hypothetical protein
MEVPTMASRRLREIPQPEEGSRPVYLAVDGPVVTGGGDLSYQCAGSAATLIRNVSPGLATEVVVKCSRCGTWNEQ